MNRVIKIVVDADPELSFESFKAKTFVVAMPSVMGYLEKLGVKPFLQGCERLVDEEYAVFVQEPVWDFVHAGEEVDYCPLSAKARINDISGQL